MATVSSESSVNCSAETDSMNSINEEKENVKSAKSWRHIFRFAKKHTELPQSERIKWHQLGRAFEFVKPHKKLMFWLGLCFIVNQALIVVMPVSFGLLIDRVLPQKDLHTLNIIVLALLVYLIVRSLFVFFERELSVRLGGLIIRDVRNKLHAHFLKMSLEYLDRYQVGRAMSRIMGDTECVRNLFLSGLLNGSASFVRFVFVLGAMFWLDWGLTLLSSALLPIFLIGFVRYTRRLKPAYHEISEDQAEMVSSVNETFNGIRVVKTYCGEERATRDFRSRSIEFLRKSLHISRTQHFSTVFWEATSCLSLISLIWYGGYKVTQGMMTVGEFVAFYGLLAQLQGPIADLISLNATLQPSLASLELIGDVLDQKPHTDDARDAQAPKPLKGAICFSKVQFSYKTFQKSADELDGEDGAAEDVVNYAPLQDPRKYTLDDVSFNANPGECIAIVGPSGSGKSTIINLLMRLYDIDAGTIEIDGVNIKKYKLIPYLRQFAIVQQDSFLFRGTVRDNIRYSQEEAPDSAVIEAARMAGAWDFIRELPKGLDTPCGERGVNLSGGQKQRICIARAMLMNPRILILDEATSALDSNTEALIQASLDKLMKGRTTFVIAHRLSTIANADCILYLENGRVAESGSHKELLKLDGKYAKLFNTQYARVKEAQTRVSNRRIISAVAS